MKRFLSVILTLAMLLTVCPAAFAEISLSAAENTDSSLSGKTDEPASETNASETIEPDKNEIFLLTDADAEVSYKIGSNAEVNTSFDDAWTEISKITNKGTTVEIKILKDFTLAAKEYELAYGQQVTIYSDTNVTISMQAGSCFLVKSGGQYNGGNSTLNLSKAGSSGTLTFDGNNAQYTTAAFLTDWSSAAYMGTLNINDGAVIQNFNREKTDYGYYGILHNNGTLNINGGKIINNTVNSSANQDAVIHTYRSLNISGGEISGNNGDNVIEVDGSSSVLTMTGGSITNNDSGYQYGSVSLSTGTTLSGGSAIITGGTIKNNTGTFRSYDIETSSNTGSLTLNGNADIGSIKLDTDKVVTTQSGFAPPTPIALKISGAALNKRYAAEGSVNLKGNFVDKDNNYLCAESGLLEEKPEPEVKYSTDGGATWTETTLTDAVTKIGADKGTIKILKDIALTETLNIGGNITMITDSADIMLKRDSTLTERPMVEVASGAELTLGSESPMTYTLTFDGGAVWSGDGYPNTSISSPNNTGIKVNECAIYNQGTLNMYCGVVVQNNGYDAEKTTLTHRGSGIGNDGTFNMYGGKIWKNSCYAQGETGGAVANNGQNHNIQSKVQFNMYDGEICYNTAFIAGGVSVGSSNQQNNGAEFNMSGGKIHHNASSEYSLHAGGGVYVNRISAFTMTGGEISENNSITGSYAVLKGAGGGIDAKGKVIIQDNAIVRNNTSNGVGDDIWCDPTNDAGERVYGPITLPSSVEIDGVTYDVHWYYDGVKAGEESNRYAAETAAEKTDLTASTEQCALKAVYTEAATPEVEWKYSEYVYPTGTVDQIKQGAMAEAITDLGVSSKNFEYIKLLKDITISESIPLARAYTLKSDDGHTYTITRADGFTGPIIEHTKYAPTIQNIIFDGGSENGIANADPIIKSSNDPATLTLTGVTLQNNACAGNGSAIYTEGKTAKIAATNLTVKNCTSAGYGTIYINDSNSNARSFNFTASTFENNSAKGGSVLYYESTTLRNATFDNCKFISNSAAETSVTTAAEALKNNNLFYVSTPAGASNGYNLAIVGETTFKGNTADTIISTAAENKGAVVFDVNSYTPCTFSAESDINKISVAVGPYLLNETMGETVINAFGAFGTTGSYTDDVTQFFTLAGLKNFTGEYNNPEITGAKFMKGSGSGDLTVNVPQKPIVKFNSMQPGYDSDGNTDKRINAINTANAAYGVISVSPEMAGELLDMGFMSMGIHRAEIGTEYTITVTPTENYKIDTDNFYAQSADYKISVAGTINEDGTGTMKLTIPEDFNVEMNELNIYVKYKEKGNKVTVASTVNGTLSVSGADNLNLVPAGTELTATATPDANYELDTLTVKTSSGISVTVTGGKFIMPDKPITVSATFKKKQFTASAAEGIAHGSISIVDNATAAWGEEVIFTVTPNTNYELDTLTLSGNIEPIYDSASNSYSFTMPTENVTINATFKKQRFTVSASGANANVSEFAASYEWGETVTFTITPAQWYVIKEVTAVGVEIIKGEGDTYSFTMPVNNVEITVTTQRPKFNITFNSKSGSAVDGQVIENGNAIVKPSAPSRTNYGFAGWYTDEAYTQKYDFTTPVTEDVTLYARWFLWGDVNGDGRANASDALLIERCFAGKINYSDLTVQMAARVSRVNNIRPNASDALLINRRFAGKIEIFPVEQTASGYEFDLENNTYLAPSEQ